MAKRNFSKIRLARLMAGVAMEDAAKAFGYDTTDTLRKFESGRQQIPLTVLKKMSELYHCSTDFLLDLTPIRQRADELWSEKNDDETFLHTIGTGTIAIKKQVEYQVPVNYLSVAENGHEYDHEPHKAVHEETLELLLAKLRSAYPKGTITVDYGENGASVTLIREQKAEPLTMTAKSQDISSVRETVCALVKKALET